MSKRMQDNLFGLVLLCVFLGFIILSLGYSPRTRMVPLPVGIFGAVLVIVQLVWQNLRPADSLQIDLLDVLVKRDEKTMRNAEPDTLSSADVQVDPLKRKREKIAFGMVVLFLGMIWLLGIAPAVFLFTGGYFVLSKHYSLLRALIYDLCFTAILYLLFVQVLQVQLYRGLLGAVIGHPFG